MQSPDAVRPGPPHSQPTLLLLLLRSEVTRSQCQRNVAWRAAPKYKRYGTSWQPLTAQSASATADRSKALPTAGARWHAWSMTHAPSILLITRRHHQGLSPSRAGTLGIRHHSPHTAAQECSQGRSGSCCTCCRRTCGTRRVLPSHMALDRRIATFARMHSTSACGSWCSPWSA